MELPHSKIRQNYIDHIKAVEAALKDATSGEKNEALLTQVQERLDTLAKKYQYSEEVGSARYKLYELQALIHYFNNDDEVALDFINQAVETRGSTYARAEKLKQQLQQDYRPHRTINQHLALPLELQSKLNNSRNFSVFFAAMYGSLALAAILLATNNGSQDAWGYFCFWGILSLLYGICAKKLSLKQPPISRGWAITAAIFGIIAMPSIVGIFIDIELWRNVSSIKKYMTTGAQAFTPDEEWKQKHKRTWSDKRQVITAIVGAVVIAAAFVGLGFMRGSSETAADAVSELKSDSSFTLPQKINENLDLTDITSRDNTVQFHYTIHGADTSNLSSASLSTAAKSDACSNDSEKIIRNKGIDMEFIYTVQENAELYTARVNHNDC